jgi:LytR cell envelope-related transcriptional attenuator
VPGKHAPESPASFYLSVARAAAGALIVLGVVAVIAVAATGSGGKKPNTQGSTPPPTVSTSPSPTSTPSTTTTPTPTRSSAAKVTVNVFNGTARNGLARALADNLAKAGYVVKRVETYTPHQTNTAIYYQPGDKAEAQALLTAHPELKQILPATSATPTNAILTIILGSDYNAG